MLALDPRIAQAESIALDRLIAIARDSDSDHEARLAAVAIFSIRGQCDDGPDAPPAPPAAPSPQQQQQPLSPHELAQLALHLPSVKPQRFLNKHTPAYWREVLNRHQPTVPAHTTPAAATGPPRLANRAA